MNKEDIEKIIDMHRLWLLEGAGRRAILIGANLSGASLRHASLSGANLSGANLRGATLPHISTFPIDLEMARVIEQSPDLFNMSEWHSRCGTTHCLAGWAVNLHPAGLTLESIYGTSAAAAMIYAKCSVSAKVPDWHASNEDALEDIRERAKQAAEATP